MFPSSSAGLTVDPFIDLEAPNVLSEPVAALEIQVEPSGAMITTFQRVVSASVGAIITSLVVTPFDVVKTRMQVQAIELGNLKSMKAMNTIENESMELESVRNRYLMNSNKALHMNGSVVGTNTRFIHSLDAAIKIGKYEGISHLYTGLSVTLWMAIPATVIYFTCYDMLKSKLTKVTQEKSINKQNEPPILSPKTWSWDTWTPLVCGISARTFAVCVISPLELLRTQMQV
ncbi:mitochondrial carrier protein [Reticulomyxa filosa]|uniref:Mitochondrial carrier protein n=1 Tax=Reticulomyxa filosa TaxID=46433 RepID=X6NB36_RETFI|nr:mitochondrial carrier protein [Reticulomyxa filosa]|eukprot:ETO23118.1 mitochondrial carrier protein [Reticulomyxa filosa]